MTFKLDDVIDAERGPKLFGHLCFVHGSIVDDASGIVRVARLEVRVESALQRRCVIHLSRWGFSRWKNRFAEDSGTACIKTLQGKEQSCMEWIDNRKKEKLLRKNYYGRIICEN